MTLFLDLDGPILDVRDRYYAVHQELVGREHAHALDRETFWELKRAKQPVSTVLDRCGLGRDAIEAYSAGWKARIEAEELLPMDRVFPGVADLLARWSRRNRLIVVTLRQHGEWVPKQLQAVGIFGAFKRVLTADPLAGHGWEAKARLMAADPDFSTDSVVVGDTEIDIRAGKRVGLKTVGVLSGIRNRAELAAESPDWLIEAVAELSKILPLDEE